jgi:hypothetical protein
MQFSAHSTSQGVNIQTVYLIWKLSEGLLAFLAKGQRSKEEILSSEVGFKSNNANAAFK